MASANYLADGGFITGSYDVTIDGNSYTLDTVDHEMPVTGAKAQTATGLPKGGAWVAGPEKMSVKIKAITGTPAPSRLVPFALSIHGFSSKYWVVTTRKIVSSNEGAVIRTYNVDIEEHVNTP